MNCISKFGMGFCLLALGCGASVDGEMIEGETASEDEIFFDVNGEALSTNEQCDTVNAHRTTNGEPGSFTTTSNYNPQGCVNGYLIDAIDYDGTIPLGAHNFRHSVTPTTASACQKQRMMAYVWRINSNGSTTFIDAESIWGTWSAGNSSCYNLIQMPDVFGIGGNGATTDYRFALSARTYSTAGDSGSSYTRAGIMSEWQSH